MTCGSVLCVGSISINNETGRTYYSSNYLVSSSHLYPDSSLWTWFPCRHMRSLIKFRTAPLHWLGMWCELTHSLINPNQLQYAGLTVQDHPFERDPPISIITNHVTIPLITSGTNIFLESSTPTQTELDNCPHVHLTLVDTEWNPHIVQLASTKHMKA